jgi:DNA-binding XRE family transcriptional regulator
MQKTGMAADQEAAKRLRQARELAGYENAAEAAQAMRIPYQTYIAHENGNNGFRRVADRYASFFRVDFKWLVTGLGKPKGVSVEADLLSLHPDDQRMILEMIEWAKAKKKA